MRAVVHEPDAASGAPMKEPQNRSDRLASVSETTFESAYAASPATSSQPQKTRAMPSRRTAHVFDCWYRLSIRMPSYASQSGGSLRRWASLWTSRTGSPATIRHR